MKNLKLIGLIGLLYSCTPNVNNITPATNQTIKPSPSITFSPTIKPSSIPTSIPSITPSITISTPSPVPTQKSTGQIKEIRVYSDDGGILSSNLNSIPSYKMLFNETKKFNTEVIYTDGVVSKEDMVWTSSNPDVIVADNSGTLKSNSNSIKSSRISISPKNNPSFVFNFDINLVESLTYKKIKYDYGCDISGYSDIPISRYSNIISSNDNIVVYSEDYGRVTFSGKVYDPNGVPVSGAIVNAKAIDEGVNWIGEAQETSNNGSYIFRNAPLTSRIVITVTKDGWTTRQRSEALKSNLQGDPCANVFNFKSIYAIQDEPEITILKINGKQVISSSKDDVFTTVSNAPKNSKPTSLQLDNSLQLTGIGNIPSLTGVNSNALEVEMTFSEPIKVSDVQNYLRITSQSGFDNRAINFTVDANYSGVEFLVSADEKMIIFKTNKAILSNKGGDEARYLIDFTQPFRDKTDKPAIDSRYFRFSPSQMNGFATFSVKNDETAPKLLGITATDGGSSNDTILLRYSEPMELINKASDPAGLSDPLEQTNLYRQLWYRDANDIKANSTPIANNTNDNNATLVGFLSGSDTDLNQFRASYMIGRVISSEISNATVKSVKTSILGNITRTPNTLPVKGNTAVNDLLRNARITGSNVLLEFSPTAFDRDDRVIVSVGNRITGSFVDRNRVPSVNDDLSVSTLGTGVEYAPIYDPAGRLVDSGDSTTSANIDVNNSQRVATAS